MDAISLWKLAQPEEADVPYAVNCNIAEILQKLDEIDKGVEYLKSVRKGGLYRTLLFRLDYAYYCGNGNNFYSVRSLFPSSVVLVDNIIKKQEMRRTQLIRCLGSHLCLMEPSSMPSLDSSEGEQLLMSPSWISRLAVPGVGILVASVFSYRLLRRIDWHKVYDFATDVWHASKNLLQDWIISPMFEIWKTIRYRGSNLALVSAAALKADMDSLERMVVNFARKHYPAIPETEVSAQVRTGDVTLMLKRYELELQAPLKNVLMGDMVSMLLIQVQKSKVDLEGAMMAMDRLLKANELNFELLAVIPVFALLYCGYSAGRHFLQRLLRRSERHTLERLRKGIHQLECTLNRQDDDMDAMMGELFVTIHRMLKYWYLLPKRWHEEYDEDFYRDLSELLSMRANNVKLWSITRMYHFFPFLQCHSNSHD